MTSLVCWECDIRVVRSCQQNEHVIQRSRVVNVVKNSHWRAIEPSLHSPRERKHEHENDHDYSNGVQCRQHESFAEFKETTEMENEYKWSDKG